MIQTHNLGFPRIGKRRELKFALENYWKGHTDNRRLLDDAKALRIENWRHQSTCDLVPVGDFSLYDQVLDMSFLLGNIPERVATLKHNKLDQYFQVARGRSANKDDCSCVRAGEMTKWFDTNYHYIVPELSKDSQFNLNPQRLLDQLNEAKSLDIKVKPVIIGPVTYLWLSKTSDGSKKLDHLKKLLPVYAELLSLLADQGVEWLQVDEPILATELLPDWQNAFEFSYHRIQNKNIKILLTTYFGQLKENLSLACKLPVEGLHIDAINGKDEISTIIDWLPAYKILSLGVINGRNIWKTNLAAKLDWLEPIAKKLKDRLWLAPSCSLIHVPIDLESEKNLDSEVKNWLAFAQQKLTELSILKSAINLGRESVNLQLNENAKSIYLRDQSKRVHKKSVKRATEQISQSLGQRKSHYTRRAEIQRKNLKLPLFPTTTIGSFPQTQSIRNDRSRYKKQEIDTSEYIEKMKLEIINCVRKQEEIGLDVLVHGEAERNDMVEYFGEQMDGYIFSSYGWVQSYGSRCVKPPILFGDIIRPNAMTVGWTQFAQSLTEKPMKGMLTGPVTILNWSFVRDDQPRSETCYQLALAIREEVLDLEKAGINIIQIDEAALREGLPLRKSQWKEYLAWAVESFRICANGVQDQTQIHTHMCYSEFNDIINAIAHMDADVITIETSRSNMELLDVFDKFQYPNDIGPGVYDIHSPNIPETKVIIELMNKAAQSIPCKQLWINPDCGLKTRNWNEVMPALQNMVAAAHKLRKAATKTNKITYTKKEAV